jgi:tetratricopeptide (TPR) repeat protein
MLKKMISIALALAVVASAGPLFADYYEQGRQYFMRKNYAKAKEMFLKAADPGGSGSAYYFLGEIEKLQGNYKEAEEYYKTAITKKNITRQYLINSYWNALLMAEQRNDYGNVVSICRSMWQKTKDASAKQKIESVINKFLWTDNTGAVEKYNEGIELKKKGKSEEARNKFHDALSIDRSFLAPKFELGMIAYKEGNLDQASSYLEDIASRIPFYAEVRLVLADIQFGRHNYRAAAEHYNNVLEFGILEGSAEYRIMIKLGTCYYNIDNYESAEQDIEKALQYNPKSAEAHLLLSAIKIKLGKKDEALKALRQASASNPNNPEIQYQMGSIYYKENDPHYVSCFDKLFTLTEGKKEYPSKYRKVFIILATKLYEDKKYGRSITILKSLDEKSQTFETRLLAAKAHYSLKEYDNAIDLFEKLSLGNDDKFILCKAYALSGRREKARSLLSELSTAGDYLSRAKQDPVLSGLARELDPGSVIKKSEPEKKEPDKAEPVKKEPEKKEPEGKKKGDHNVKKKSAGDDNDEDNTDDDEDYDDEKEDDDG